MYVSKHLTLAAEYGAVPDHDKSFIVHGILGIIKLHTTEFLVVITNRKKVAHVLGSNIYLATDFRMLPVRNEANPSLLRHPIEKRLLNLVKESLYSGPMYFSYDFDVTSCLQRQARVAATEGSASLPMWKRADDRFFWNYHLQEPLMRHPQNLSAFILPVMFGFLEVKLTSIHNRAFVLGLVARRSRFRAGTRYFSRGIDEDGHVSNFNETEQFVLIDPPQSVVPTEMEQIQGKARMSYVQTRGSVPVYWAEINNLRYKPDLLIPEDPRTLASAQKHFDEQVAIYGKNYLVNLVNQNGYERPVKEAYENTVQQLSNPMIQYTYFDFHHACKGMKFDNVMLLIDQLQREGLDLNGYFMLDTNANPIAQMQQYVVRTNCMDCLDRTNVVQGTLARLVLNHQLRALEVLGPTDKVEDHISFLFMFRNLWADHADVISKAYSGTGALKTDFTRTGKRSMEGALQDGLNSLTRYVKNNFFDGARQDSYDLFTGAWDPEQRTIAPDTRAWLERSMPWLLCVSLLFWLLSFFLDANPARPYKAQTNFSLFRWFWATLATFSLAYIWQRGVLYVGWPTLNRPTRLIDYDGPGYYSGLRGRKGAPNEARKKSLTRKMQ
ncbi:Phosphoinositide phosphatase sac1 [Malassezia psittaci]|uniref:Phosphoinositide phosphatase sac1 n=1 Tax=Malassezia psittaci TaxID=1821823 RepID=A0AAF0JJP8_9BASI|nr:Phosphoinositide phosphatase sac1 [Malassezia psittaci]